MGTKTISLRDEAYQRLRRARRTPSESFSDVVMRAVWPDQKLSAGEFLHMVRERGAVYSAPELDSVDAASAADRPPTDKWPAA
jgi:predicted CopG family antitoxin